MSRLVKSPPRFRCAFCKRTATKPYMDAHEKICWRNPSRYCEFCDNKGTYVVVHQEADYGENTLGPELSEELPCPYCSQFDAKKLPEASSSEPASESDQVDATLNSRSTKDGE